MSATPRHATAHIDDMFGTLKINDGSRSMINAPKLVLMQLRVMISNVADMGTALMAQGEMSFRDNHDRTFKASIVIQNGGTGFIDFRGEFEEQAPDYVLRIDILDLEIK